MNVVYELRKNAPRIPLRHIDNGHGKPICQFIRGAEYKTENGEPTCKQCILIKKMRG